MYVVLHVQTMDGNIGQGTDDTGKDQEAKRRALSKVQGSSE